MAKIIFTSTLHEATDSTPEWTLVPRFKSLDRKITKDGITYQIFNKKERQSPLLLRIAVIAFTLLFAGIPLIFSQTMRSMFFKGKEAQRFAVPLDVLKPQADKEFKRLTGRNERPATLVPYYREIDKIRCEDELSPMTGWKKGLGSDEVEQALEHFNHDWSANNNAKKTNIKITYIGEISIEEKKIVGIVRDYLQAIHGVTTSMGDATLSLPANGQREKFGHTQYALYPMHDSLYTSVTKTSFSMGFTNQDVYPGPERSSVNFLYGQAVPSFATGIFSTYRLDGEGETTAAIRLMKLASHEFAHMRGLDHCTKYMCGVQGINNLNELDASPLLFCAMDMAKICLINNWSVKEGYRRQLQFFENFSQNYSLPCDFSGEIALLNKKIRKLDL